MQLYYIGECEITSGQLNINIFGLVGRYVPNFKKYVLEKNIVTILGTFNLKGTSLCQAYFYDGIVMYSHYTVPHSYS